jgi:HK97 gp10 family phage protein
MKVKIDGLRELDAALGEFSKATARGILRRVGIKALEPVAERMRQMAPDDPDTGGNDLRSSIMVGTKLSARQAKGKRGEKKAGETSFVEVYAGPGPLPHAHLQEFGTAHHGPQPYARPAWDEGKDGVLKSVATDLGAEIDKTAKRLAARAAKKALRGA